ncbi:MAG: response regulator [bacterium]|nr:response regulator [bacterium]MDT8395240.1 response regulator [bacterium]
MLDRPQKKILVIEDDPDIRSLTGFILRDDYEVISSEDGRKGMEKAREERPDLVLLDIYMAGLSGFEVCRMLKEEPETASIPVIMLTAGAQKDEVSEGYASGADDYIIKPFEPGELIERIEKLLLRSRI